MNFVRTSARLLWRGRSRAVARNVAGRRFVVFSVALAAVLASVALTTGPASATTFNSSCVDANAGQVYDGGAITQLACDSTDPYQEWNTNLVYMDGRYFSQLQNVGANEYDNGAADCLDADAYQVKDTGAITQYACNNSDPFQLWIITQNAQGNMTLQNYGALKYDNAADCLDADAYGNPDGGPIWQWGCDPDDPYQQWIVLYGDNGRGMDFVNVGVYYRLSGTFSL
jgi:Ricin-type beta-trefoil lectin domain